MTSKDQERDQRLAEALRANLKRRKQQQRDGGSPQQAGPGNGPNRDQPGE